MQRPFKLLIFILLAISSCIGNRETKLSDKDLVINERLFSPNKKYIVYDYSYDIGALGYSRGSYAIVKTADTNGIINKHIFDCIAEPTYACYTLDKWVDTNTLQVTIDNGPFIRFGLPVDTSSFKVGEVNIKVAIRDHTNGLPAIIEHYSVSPDGNKLLVAYIYSGVSDLNISAINIKDSLPTIGNIFTSLDAGNSILFGKWSANDEISIIVENPAEEYFQSQLNKQNKFKVKILGEKYIQKYSGIQGGWYNKELYPNDGKSKEIILNNFGITKGVVVDSYGWGDSYYTNFVNFFYEYKVNRRIYKSYFRATSKKCKLQKGDSIEIVYDKLQPIIHEPRGNNSR